MAVLGVRVVRADGDGLEPWRGVVRALVFPLSFLLFGLGFLGILVQREHRALHDLIAGTAVVYSWDARAARLRFLARQAELPTGPGSPASPLTGDAARRRRAVTVDAVWAGHGSVHADQPGRNPSMNMPSQDRSRCRHRGTAGRAGAERPGTAAGGPGDCGPTGRRASGLDSRTFALVKVAALIALDAPRPPTCGRWATPWTAGCTPADLLGVLHRHRAAGRRPERPSPPRRNSWWPSASPCPPRSTASRPGPGQHNDEGRQSC